MYCDREETNHPRAMRHAETIDAGTSDRTVMLAASFGASLQSALDQSDQDGRNAAYAGSVAEDLISISTRLHTLDEQRCNGVVDYESYISETDDLIDQAQDLAHRLHDLAKAYHQSDPRGASLYIVFPHEYGATAYQQENGEIDISQVYNRGTAVPTFA